MACSISISSVVGTLSGGNLVALTISGSVTDCPSVQVSVLCFGSSPLTKVVPGSTTTGNWSAVFSGAELTGFGCKCGDNVEVNTQCTVNTTCVKSAGMKIDCYEEGENSYDCKKTYKRWFCPLVFFLMTLSFAIAIALIILDTCLALSVVSLTLADVGTAFLALGFLGLAAYYLLCRKCQCGWVLKLLWRVAFAVGAVITTFAGSCSTFLLPGLILIAVGLALLIWWARRCKKTLCQVLKEVILVIATFIVPTITFVLGLAALQASLLVLFTIGSSAFTFADLILVVLFSVTVYEQANC